MSWDAKLYQRFLATRRFGREFVWHDEVDSTNRWLSENSSRFTMTGAVTAAGHQTHGRGRYDRIWDDRPGTSLLFSVLLRHAVDLAGSGFLTLIPGIALAEVLMEHTNGIVPVRLKWPNDVLLNGRKVAGILGQSTVVGTRVVTVVGVGVNVGGERSELPPEYHERATSVFSETRLEVSREVLLANVLARWETMFDDLIEGRSEELKLTWESLGPEKGSRIVRREGNEQLAGTFDGIGATGELLLRDDQGVLHSLFSGDLDA